MITADMVKTLRDKTGAGMMDCKKALTAANGDMDLAIENLRKSGIAKAEKKSGRATNQGKVVVAKDGKFAAMVEVLCETDFAANTDKFMDFVNSVAKTALTVAKTGDVTAEVNEAEAASLTEKIAVIGENMQIRRAVRWESAGKVGSYIHGGGRVGVMVNVEGEEDDAFLVDMAMHVAAFRPAYITSADVPEEVIAKEKEIAAVQLAGKPANMIENILKGKINKWFTEVCFVNQPWIKDDKTSLVKLKPNMVVKQMARWEVGEEI